MRCGSQAIKVHKAATVASPGSTANLVKGVKGVLGPSASVKRRLSVRLNKVNTQREAWRGARAAHAQGWVVMVITLQ